METTAEDSSRAFQIPVSPPSEELNRVPSTKESKQENVTKKIICRYGSGCTHLSDAAHREKFWHPKVQRLTDELLQSHFICNECAFATSSLTDLQLHLKRKTAWSNNSLIGCRISCLVDSKEWHEGFVTNYHKSGKHLVEFRMANEKRWFTMKKTAFYIVERPLLNDHDCSEFKHDGEDETNLAPVEDNWVYAEDITLEYAFAQSVLFKIYGHTPQETGHLTKGHVCLTDSDRATAQHMKSSLLYGELLPRGANKAFGAGRLEVNHVAALFDLGMGTGKIIIQAFLQFKNLRYVYGIELSSGRFKLAEEAALLMVKLLGQENYHIQHNPGRFLIITETCRVYQAKTNEYEIIQRILHMDCGNMFSVQNLGSADIVMMETDIPMDMYPELFKLLSTMKDGARMLSYLDFRKIFDLGPLPLKQLDINRPLSDRYPTSWSVQRGHHFFLWMKVHVPEPSYHYPYHYHHHHHPQQQHQQQQPHTTSTWTTMTQSLTGAYHHQQHQPQTVTGASGGVTVAAATVSVAGHHVPRKESLSAEEQFLERLASANMTHLETSSRTAVASSSSSSSSFFFCFPLGWWSFFSGRNTHSKRKVLSSQPPRPPLSPVPSPVPSPSSSPAGHDTDRVLSPPPQPTPLGKVEPAAGGATGQPDLPLASPPAVLSADGSGQRLTEFALPTDSLRQDAPSATLPLQSQSHSQSQSQSQSQESFSFSFSSDIRSRMRSSPVLSPPVGTSDEDDAKPASVLVPVLVSAVEPDAAHDVVQRAVS